MADSPDDIQSISQLGEQELIRRFFTKQSSSGKDSVVGIGDDCAVLDLDSENYRLVSTDQLLEGIHFLPSISTPADIGYKSAAVNISDIASMSGRPTGIFLSLGFPSTTGVSWAKQFADGFFKLCSKYDIPLLGGDTTGSKQGIVINVTIFGIVKKENLKLRSDAKVDDVVCVTGTLGDAAAGFQVLQAGLKSDRDKGITWLAKKHRRPSPAVEQGQWLGDQSAVHAMIDLSDGLATDGKHLAEASNREICINTEQMPFSEPFEKYTNGNKELRRQLALGGGEDYQLLLTVARDEFNTVNKNFENRFGHPLYRIGTVKEGKRNLIFLDYGKIIEQSNAGFNHFQ